MNLKVLFITLLALQQLAAPVVFAGDGNNNSNPPKDGSPYLEFGSNAPGTRSNGPDIKVQTYVPRNQVELDNAIDWATSELTQTQASKRKIVFASGDRESKAESRRVSTLLLRKLGRKTRSSQRIDVSFADVPESAVAESEAMVEQKAQQLGNNGEEVGRLKQLFYKHERIAFTLVKGGVKGAVTGAALIVAAGLPVHVAVPIALYSAFQSGMFQYFNPKVENFLNGDPEKKERLLRESRFGFLRVKIWQLSKSSVIGITVNSATALVTALAGVPKAGFIAEAINVLGATAVGTASRGVWSTAIASETRDNIHRNEGNPQVQAYWQRRSNIIRFSLSMVSAFGGILTILGMPMGYWIQGIMGGAGMLYTLRHWLKHRNSNQETNFRPSWSARNCKTVFN